MRLGNTGRHGLRARLRHRHQRHQRLRRRSRQQRHSDRRTLALVHDIAQRAQDRAKILARTASQRRHRDADDKAVAIGGPGGRRPGGDAGAISNCRADQIGQPLQNIDAHGALAADTESGGAVKSLGHILVGGKRGAPGCGQMRHIVDTLHFCCAAKFQRPELRCQGARRRL